MPLWNPVSHHNVSVLSSQTLSIFRCSLQQCIIYCLWAKTIIGNAAERTVVKHLYLSGSETDLRFFCVRLSMGSRMCLYKFNASFVDLLHHIYQWALFWPLCGRRCTGAALLFTVWSTIHLLTGDRLHSSMSNSKHWIVYRLCRNKQGHNFHPFWARESIPSFHTSRNGNYHWFINIISAEHPKNSDLCLI